MKTKLIPLDYIFFPEKKEKELSDYLEKNQNIVSAHGDHILLKGVEEYVKVNKVSDTKYLVNTSGNLDDVISIVVISLIREKIFNKNGHCKIKNMGINWEVPCVIMNENHENMTSSDNLYVKGDNEPIPSGNQ